MLLCMRTTIDLSDELFRLAKRRAADEGVPLREVVQTALRRYLAVRGSAGGYRLRWRTEKGRILPGVALDDRDSLFDAMERRK
jgi:hypothetical protein